MEFFVIIGIISIICMAIFFNFKTIGGYLIRKVKDAEDLWPDVDPSEHDKNE